MLWILAGLLLIPGRVNWEGKTLSTVPILFVVIEYLMNRYLPAAPKKPVHPVEEEVF